MTVVEQESQGMRFEGNAGVRNLAILANKLGYKDTTYFGQFGQASYGDLIDYLEDNPGAIEAVYNFMNENSEEIEDEDELASED